MKIAVLKKDYDQWGGGAERYAANACRLLAERGHELTVYSETFSCDAVANLKHAQVPRVLLDGCSRTTAFHRRVQKVLNQEDYDLVYALSRSWPCDVFRVAESIEAKWMELRYPWWEKLNPRHIGIMRLEKKVYDERNVRAVVTNAKLTRDQILEYYDFPEDKIHVIRNGIDREKFRPAGNDEKKRHFREKAGVPVESFVLMFAAANFRSKGLEYAVRGLAALSEKLKSRTELMVMGDYDPAWFKGLAHSLGVAERVHFPGKKENMRDYYLAADLFFYPTIYEPCANVCLEALACGLPVLTTRLNGAAELVKHEENGFLVDNFRCQDEMVEYIQAFSSYPERRLAEMHAAACEASVECDWQLHADKLESLFASLCN